MNLTPQTTDPTSVVVGNRRRFANSIQFVSHHKRFNFKVNVGFKLIRAKLGKRTGMYTVQLDGANQTEFERFFEESRTTSLEELQGLLAKLYGEILDRKGCQTRFFRKEGTASDSLAALWEGRLRLYCAKWGETLLVVGGGGIKSTATYQEDPELHACVKLLQYVEERIREAMEDKELKVGDRCFRNTAGEIDEIYFPPILG